MQAVVSLAFALGVMLSPDTLILLGNTLGHEGRAALNELLVAGALHVLTARAYGRLVDPDTVESLAATYPKDKTLVLYCACPDEFTSARGPQKLIDKGFTNVYALKGGWHEWHRAQFPIETK